MDLFGGEAAVNTNERKPSDIRDMGRPGRCITILGMDRSPYVQSAQLFVKAPRIDGCAKRCSPQAVLAQNGTGYRSLPPSLPGFEVEIFDLSDRCLWRGFNLVLLLRTAWGPLGFA
jgi:hypothetical protein